MLVPSDDSNTESDRLVSTQRAEETGAVPTTTVSTGEEMIVFNGVRFRENGSGARRE
jgi:hypothetical protein